MISAHKHTSHLLVLARFTPTTYLFHYTRRLIVCILRICVRFPICMLAFSAMPLMIRHPASSLLSIGFELSSSFTQVTYLLDIWHLLLDLRVRWTFFSWSCMTREAHELFSSGAVPNIASSPRQHGFPSPPSYKAYNSQHARRRHRLGP